MSEVSERPSFVLQHAEGLRDFWSTYEARYEAVQRSTLELAGGHPEFGPLLRGLSADDLAAQNKRSREMLRRAIVEGEWTPYVADMRSQGAVYAKRGISFGAWYDVVRALQRAMVPALVEEYGCDHARLAAAITAMLEYIDFAMATIAQQYVETKQETSLRLHATFLDSIVENIPNMVFVKDAQELRFRRLNKAGEELLGMSREELLGKSDFDLFPPEQAESFQARDRETLATKAIVDISEVPVQTKAGERWLHTKKVPVLDDRGVPVFLLGISEDITERRRAERELEDAKNAAEAANAELEAFSYSVAHDLRAPLRAIDGFSLALDEDYADRLDDQAKDYLKRVRSSAKYMGQLIDGLLGLSRVSRRALERETVDLSHLAEQSLGRLREAAPERHVEVSIEPGLSAEGDPQLLAAVFDNLLGNAWKFTSKCDHARIEVGKRVEDKRDVFFVRDNGAGFDPAYSKKLFGAFQRLHRAAEFEGTGIGLATVQRIVQRHGGRIWAEGAVGRGATFSFTL